MIHPSPCPPEVRNRGWDRLSPLISEQTQPEKPPPTSTCRLGKAAPSSTVSGRGAIRSSVRRLPGSEWKGVFFKLYFEILFPPQASCRAPLRQQLTTAKHLAESWGSFWSHSTSKGKTSAESSEKNLRSTQEDVSEDPIPAVFCTTAHNQNITPYFSKRNFQPFTSGFNSRT